MYPSGQAPIKPIYIKVFGFSDAERRLLLRGLQKAKTRRVEYAVWRVEAEQHAEAVLIDGDSWEAGMELANPQHDLLKLIWVGERKHPSAWRNFSRPLQWTQILDCLDQLAASIDLVQMQPEAEAPSLDYADTEASADFVLDTPANADAAGQMHAEPDAEIDFDVHLADYSDTQPVTELVWDSDTTQPMPLEDEAPDTPDAESPRAESRVLVIESQGHDQLYWRAKLGSTGLVYVDEAASTDAARDLLRLGSYKLVVLDLDSSPTEGWDIIREISAGMKSPGSAAQHLLVTGQNLSRLDEVRAWMSGASTMRKPLHPGKLKQLLERVQSTI